MLPKILSFSGLDMYASEKYYNDIFTTVADDIRNYRDERYNSKQFNWGKGTAFFNVANEDYLAFEGLIKSERGVITDAVGIILSALMKHNNIKLYTPEQHYDCLNRPNCYFSVVYENTEHQKIGIKCIWDLKQLNGIAYFLKKVDELKLKEEVDKIEIIILEKEYQYYAPENKGTYYYKPEDQPISELHRYNKKIHNNSNGFVSVISLDCFFIQHFGKEEYSLFENASEEFNKKINENTGYKTLFMPNETEVAKFRNQATKMLVDFDYKKEMIKAIDQLNQSGKFKNQNVYNHLINNAELLHEKCFNKYAKELRFQVLTGKSDYADSFISSEWYFSSSFETDILDKTAIAVGYLKSAEQLLYRILRLHINNGNYAINHTPIYDENETTQKLKGAGDKYPKLIPFNEEFEIYFDKTFGSLNTFVKNNKNKGLFENNTCNEWKTFIIEFLFEYSKNDRNEHLHKDNIYSTKEIISIRNRTILLYFLLLGSLSISNTDLLLLGGDEAFSKNNYYTDLVSQFSEWLEPKIKVCKTSSTIILSPYIDLDNGLEVLRFAETESFICENYDLESKKLHFDPDEFSFFLGNHLNDKEKCSIISFLINTYIEIRERVGRSIKNQKIVLLLYGYGYHKIQ